MSSRKKRTAGRTALLERMGEAGRELSDAAVLFHSAVAERIGLGPSDWKTLGLLQKHGRLTAGELSAHSGLAPASVTGIIDRLESAGWVERGKDPIDGRRVVVELNQAAMGARMSDFFGGLLQRLGDLYEKYSDDELELIADFMVAAAGRQKEATADLSRSR